VAGCDAIPLPLRSFSGIGPQAQEALREHHLTSQLQNPGECELHSYRDVIHTALRTMARKQRLGVAAEERPSHERRRRAEAGRRDGQQQDGVEQVEQAQVDDAVESQRGEEKRVDPRKWRGSCDAHHAADLATPPSELFVSI
jgi:hypothetical protein